MRIAQFGEEAQPSTSEFESGANYQPCKVAMILQFVGLAGINLRDDRMSCRKRVTLGAYSTGANGSDMADDEAP